MRIVNLAVSNFLGVSAVTLIPREPVVVVTGGNGAGKTSLYQAIKLALLDDLPRIDLKRDAGELVRGGAGKGAVTAIVMEGEDSTPFSIVLPSRVRDGALIALEECDALRICLDPAALLALAPPDRAKLALELSGVSMTADAIAARLGAHGVVEDVVAALRPLLVLGFDKCVAHAKEEAAQARGEWRGVTGETYGSLKAAGWTPGPAGQVPDAPVQLGAAVEKHSTAVAALAGLEAARKAREAYDRQATADKDLAPQAPALRAKVASLRPAAEAYVEPTTLECPKCNESLVLADGKLAVFIPAPHPTVKPATKAKARSELTVAERELAAAEAAVARLAAPVELAMNPTDNELQDARECVTIAADLLRSVNHAQEAYARAVAEVAKVQERADKAAAAHAKVVAWEAAATALSPAGIPSELMAAAMAPMRAALKAVCASGAVQGWPLPEMADDGNVSAWGRPWQLLSESEQYRVAAVLAAAIASLSGVSMIVLDRGDVLEPAERANLLEWLMDLTDAGHLEQAWVFMTTKQCLKGGDGFETHWLDNGAEP